MSGHKGIRRGWSLLWAVMLLSPRLSIAAEGRKPIAGPAVLSQPGSYLLVRDIDCSGGGCDCSGNPGVLTVQADFVTLDLGGHVIDATGSTCHGVAMEGNFRNAVIRNGTIIVASGKQGIRVNTSNPLFSSIRIQDLALDGNNQGAQGVWIKSSNMAVKLKNLTVTHVTGEGVYLEQVGKAFVKNVRVRQTGGYGIECFFCLAFYGFDVMVAQAGDTGLSIEGLDNLNIVLLHSVFQFNGADGVHNTGGAGILRDNLFEHNNQHGLELTVIASLMHYLIRDNNANQNEYDGFHIGGNGTWVVRNRAKENGRHGLSIDACPPQGGHMIQGNYLVGNGFTYNGYGLYLNCQDNIYQDNVMDGNQNGMFIDSNNYDAGGNIVNP